MSRAATPLRKCGDAVRIDLISPWWASNSLRAPHPSSSASCHTLQNVIRVAATLRDPGHGCSPAANAAPCSAGVPATILQSRGRSSHPRGCSSKFAGALLPGSRRISKRRDDRVARRARPFSRSDTAHARDSRHSMNASVAATMQAMTLAQTGMTKPLTMTSHPSATRSNWSSATSENTAMATVVKGFNRGLR